MSDPEKEPEELKPRPPEIPEYVLYAAPPAGDSSEEEAIQPQERPAATE